MRYPSLLKGRPYLRQTANEFAANFRSRGDRLYYEAALRLDQEDKSLTLLSYSYCITGISKPADTPFINFETYYTRRTIMEKRKPNDLPPEQCLAVDTDTLCKLLCCGRHTAVQIGDLANARITMNTRVLWSVQRIKEYLYDISG